MSRAAGAQRVARSITRSFGDSKVALLELDPELERRGAACDQNVDINTLLS